MKNISANTGMTLPSRLRARSLGRSALGSRPGLIIGAVLAASVPLMAVAVPAGAQAQQSAGAVAAACGLSGGGDGTPELYPGESLASGQALVAGSMEFHMGADGNVVLTDDNHAVWANGKTGFPGATLNMQTGGNLVEIYNGTAIWNAGTGGDSCAYLTIGTHGWPRVLYQGNIVWPKNSPPGYPYNYFDPNQSDVLFAPNSLLFNSPMSDAKGNFTLLENNDGELQEYNSANVLVWHAGSVCNGTSQTTMQSDGNLVDFCDFSATWSSGTGGNPSSYGIYLHILTTGEIILASNFGTIYWTNGL